MTTIRAEEVRIPRAVRDAVARHEEVVVVNRERPVYVISHPGDRLVARRGRPLREVAARLADVPLPDEAFAGDMEEVMASVGPDPRDPWERS